MIENFDDLNIIDWTNRLDENCYDNRQRFLVLHNTGDNSAETTINTFNERKVSSHYIVDKDGQIYRTVNDDKRAWHAGVSNWSVNNGHNINNINYSSIGIEIVNPGDKPFPAEQISSVANLSKVIIDKFDIDPKNIITHADIAPGRKFDPSGYFDWKQFYDEVGIFPHLFESHLTPEEKSTVKFEESTAYSNDVKNLQKKLNQHGYQVVADGYYGHKTAEVVEAFNRHFSPEIFQKEKINDRGDTIQNPLNQKWYDISQERLDFLLANA